MFNPLEITHIDQLLPHIAGKEEFDVKHREKYIAIDYVYATEDTFNHPLLLECRGIKFYKDGTIMARPFQKFFNLNQVPETNMENVDWSKEHVKMAKLDGSMIHPAWVSDNEMLLMTRAGYTDVSMQAERMLNNTRLKDDFIQFCRHCQEDGITPMFEFISPENRIVIKYTDASLVLLGARYIKSGVYLTRKELEKLANAYYIPIVDVHTFDDNMAPEDFIKHTRELQDAEGYVVQFQNNGAMLKIKADDYVLKHRTKSYFDHEKNVLKIILENIVDDLLPLLDEEQQTQLNNYVSTVKTNMVKHAHTIQLLVVEGMKLDRKTFATETMLKVDKRLKGLVFTCLDRKLTEVKDILLIVEGMYAKWTTTQTKLDENRDLIGTTWEG